VDLFVPEVYLNYGANHLGMIDEYVRRTRQVGCMDRMIPGLGINVVEDREKRPTVVPTREDVLRQIRRIKTIAPELPGVGFFTSNAAPGVAEYADELREQHYLNPVLTLVSGSLQTQVKGDSIELRAALRNHGGMTVRKIEIQFGQGYGIGFRPILTQTAATLPPEGEATVAASLPLQAGSPTPLESRAGKGPPGHCGTLEKLSNVSRRGAWPGLVTNRKSGIGILPVVPN